MSITQARLKELLEYDPETGVFTNRVSRSSRAKAGATTSSSLSKQGYLRICIDWNPHLAHRLAWLYVYGSMPQGMIDHINGDRTDNRICNLREASAHLNQQNRRRANRRSKTGLLGVSVADNKFVASIHADGKTRRLGRFCSAEEAHAAYLAAKRQLHEGCTI